LLVFSDQSRLHPALAAFIAGAEPAITIPLREGDEERPIVIYALDGRAILDTVYPQFQAAIPNLSTEAQFGEGLTLLGYQLADDSVVAGEMVRLATLWRIREAVAPETVLFTHLVGADGVPIAQADRLDVPSYYWQAGDVFIQLHEFSLPLDLAAGDYPLAIGAYNQQDGARWSITVDGEAADDILFLTFLTVEE